MKSLLLVVRKMYTVDNSQSSASFNQEYKEILLGKLVHLHRKDSSSHIEVGTFLNMLSLRPYHMFRKNGNKNASEQRI
jgi:hypothetical protein